MPVTIQNGTVQGTGDVPSEGKKGKQTYTDLLSTGRKKEKRKAQLH